MKINDRLSILFFLSVKRQTKDGTAPIYVRITITGTKPKDGFPIGKKCPINLWDSKKKKVIGNSSDAKETNSYIQKMQTDIGTTYTLLSAKQEIITPESLRSEYEKIYKSKADEVAKPVLPELKSFSLSNTIDPLIVIANEIDKEERKIEKIKNEWVKIERLRLIDEVKVKLKKDVEQAIKTTNLYIENKDKSALNLMDMAYEFLLFFLRKVASDNREYCTLKRFNVTKNKLASFSWYHFKKSAFPITDIKPNFATELYEYLTNVDECGHNTANKHIKNVKQILDRCMVNGWIIQNPITNYKCTYIDPDIEALTIHEIIRLINTDFGEKLNSVRDCFLFSCFTGFAYEETYQLEPGDIFIGIDGKEWIGTGRKKTDRPEIVPLFPFTKIIINKYTDHPCRVIDGKLLPVYSNQHYNRCLKEIAEIAEIKIELTTHVARHTFATTIALENGMPLITLSKILGHQTIRSTTVYAKVTKSNISQNMNSIEGKIFDEDGLIKIDSQQALLHA